MRDKAYRDAAFFFFTTAFKIASSRLGLSVISERVRRLMLPGLATGGASARPAIWKSEEMIDLSEINAGSLFIIALLDANY